MTQSLEALGLSRCRGDAVSLSRRASALEAGLCEREVELERLSVEHAALRLAHAELEAGLSRAERENSRLLQQIVEEKRGEAERMNRTRYRRGERRGEGVCVFVLGAIMNLSPLLLLSLRWCKLVMKLQRRLQSKPAQCCPLSV
ncbi:autophagy-related protein 16 isoform X1 [Huso huso]|uniref:Autophagy-related protein 16 isoform X1 n=1 Tax=Huso huso TaxID=61971 RepID=A0ABR0YZX1_HUSHU